MVTTSVQEKLKKVIPDELLSINIVMWALYSKFGTVNKAVVHLNDW